MKRNILFIVLALLVFELNAQSLPYLTIPSDARTMGMGGAGVAMNADAFALYNNPAAMALSANGGAVALTYEMWQPKYLNNTLLDGAGFIKIGEKIGLGASARYFAHQSYDIFDKNGAAIGQFSPKEIDFALGASYKVIDILSIGASVRYNSSALGEQFKGSAISADVAVMAKIGGLNVALSAANIGSKVKYSTTAYDLPFMAKLGAAYNLSINDANQLTVSAGGEYLFNDSAIMAAAGLEYSFRQIVFLRAGYHYGDAAKAIPSYASVGAGFKFAGVSLSGAFIIAGSESPLKNSLSVSLGYEF